MVLRSVLAVAAWAPVLAHECLMIGKVYEEISKQLQDDVKGWEDCAKLCEKSETCSLFTFKVSTYGGSCWLITDAEKAMMLDDPFSVSGSRECLAKRTPEEICPYPGMFYDDSIMPDPHLWTPTWVDCQKKCRVHDTCKYFTWKEDTAPAGGCWLLPSHNFTHKHTDSRAISGLQKCPWEKGSSDLLMAKAGDVGSVILDCRAPETLYKDPMLPAPRMYLEKWENCQIECDKSETCEAYSYKKDTNPPGGCWLYRNMKYGKNVTDVQAISGRKFCKIPSALDEGDETSDRLGGLGGGTRIEIHEHSKDSWWRILPIAAAVLATCCLACCCFFLCKKRGTAKRGVAVESSDEEQPPLRAGAAGAAGVRRKEAEEPQEPLLRASAPAPAAPAAPVAKAKAAAPAPVAKAAAQPPVAKAQPPVVLRAAAKPKAAAVQPPVEPVVRRVAKAPPLEPSEPIASDLM